MFSLREYIKKGFLEAVGKMSNYQIILNSAGWMEKGVLTEEDLTEISTAIEAWEAEQNAVHETVDPSEEIPVEDLLEEIDEILSSDETVIDDTEEVTEETTEDPAETTGEVIEDAVEESTEETTE